MSLVTEGAASLCSSCQAVLRLPGPESDGYTPVGKYNFLYTSSHNFDIHDTHDHECDFYSFLLGILRSRDVRDMVKDQTGLEEQLRRIRLPVVMCVELWFRDDFSGSDRGTRGLFDECLLIGSLFIPLNPGLQGRQWRGGYVCFPLASVSSSSSVPCNFVSKKAATWPVGDSSSIDSSSSPRLPPQIENCILGPQQLSLIQSHLAQCTTECGHSHSDPTFLPTHLVDVRGPKPRVIDTTTLCSDSDTSSGPEADIRYLTLSYCWGGGSQLKLTRDSAAMLQSEGGFDISDASETQRDTFALARALEIPFVWIDALCILQGDKDQWTRESSLMHKIYGTSYVTVCSLTSSSCNEGYLSRDWPQLIIPASPSGVQGTGRSYMLKSWLCSPAVPDGRKLAQQGRVTSQWGRRAWTFQEQALSTRQIYFTRLGVQVSCDRLEVGELNPGSETAGPLQSFLQPEPSHPDATMLSPYQTWYSDIIPSYSRRQVTNPSDWLPALSGLAQRFAATRNSGSSIPDEEYVAGLWRSDLMYGLFWSWLRPPVRSLKLLLDALDPEASSSGLDSYICPSWSWVGRGHIFGVWSGGGTGFIGRGPRLADGSSAWNVKPAYRRLNVKVQPKTADPFGQIAGASLFLNAPVYSLSRCKHPSLLRDDDRRYLFHGERSLVNPIHRFRLDSSTECSIIFDWAVQTPEEDLGRLWLVLVGLSSTPGASKKISGHNRGEAFGLVVHPTRHGEGKYVRVGSFGYVNPRFFEACETRVIEVI